MSSRFLLTVVGVLLLAQPATAAPARPDLRVPLVRSSVVRPAPGSSVVVTVTTHNTGRRTARASSLTLFLSRDARRSADDRVLRHVAVPALRARRRVVRRVRVVLPAALRPGVVQLLACADARGRVREARERNNCRATRLTVVTAAVPPATGQQGTTVVGGAGVLDPPPGPAPATPPQPASAPSPAAPAPTDGDADGDGVPDPRDCAPADPLTHPGATDVPDVPAMRDANCDGLDGDVTRSVFVSPTGDDAAPGTRELPKRTVAAAIALAGAGMDVLVAEGTYAEGLEVRDGIGVHGGYTADWRRGLDRVTHLAAPSRIGAQATDIAVPTRLQLLTVTASSGKVLLLGASSYGLLAVRAPGLVVERVTAVAARAGAGLAGADGTVGAPGGKGGDGVKGDCDEGRKVADRGAGGVAGTSPAPGRGGGIGGSGGEYNDSRAFDGGKGHGAFGGTGGVGGGNGAEPGTPGDHGLPGQFLGTPGLGGSGITWSGAELVARAGTTGGTGDAGFGGGGGGGGGGEDYHCLTCFRGHGDGAGGGGGGGAGGTGGRGGSGGGGSYGMAFVLSDGAVVRDSSATAGAAGSGGRGGSAGQGGAGGPAGIGADSGCPDEVGDGGDGGNGGAGLPGGHGGGGAGGASVGLLTLASALTVENAAGAAGTPGSGGVSAAQAGDPGVAADRLDL